MRKIAFKVFNTLTRTQGDFTPAGRVVKLYTCGPTVYDYAHIGNMRTFLFEDFLKRALIFAGYSVKHVMNITDVGHLTDTETEEDKIERAARQKRQTAKQVTALYTRAFKADLRRLNILRPSIFSKATEHISEQIALIKKLEAKGFTYHTSDGVYFDTAKFPRYAALSGKTLSELKEGARVQVNSEKRNPTDFAVWKFSPKNQKRQMEWQSPWGIGFPGWHLECSAMSMKYLGRTLDLHCGGIDLIFPHHSNEIAQSEAATGVPFVRTWMHGAFVIIDQKRMGKSEGNMLTISDIEKMKVNPLAYRYLVLNTHYRKELHFSLEGLRGAQHAYERLIAAVAALDTKLPGPSCAPFEEKFARAVASDLNMPAALSISWEMLKSSCRGKAKLTTLRRFDAVLGLDIIKKAGELSRQKKQIPARIMTMVLERETARKKKDFRRADRLREMISKRGYELKDSPQGTIVEKRVK